MRKSIIAFIVILLLVFSTSVSFAADNPDITIVNPVTSNTIYSDNLVISVKITKPTTMNVYVNQLVKTVNSTNVAITWEEYQDNNIEIKSVSLVTSESITTTNNLSFHTKKIENVKPGVYRVVVDTVDVSGKVLYSDSTTVAVKAKEENPADSATLDSTQTGPGQFLKGLIKSIFGN